MYANILLSTDGSDVARKGLKHGFALAKALNVKVTVITVTEPLPINVTEPLSMALSTRNWRASISSRCGGSNEWRPQ
jgi:nucleotide-binding universal stress UspA family protein